MSEINDRESAGREVDDRPPDGRCTGIDAEDTHRKKMLEVRDERREEI